MAKTVTMTRPIISILLVVAILIFILVLALLIRMITDRETYSILLLKSLGYHNREVTRLYLGNYIYLVVLALIISIPVSWETLKPAWRSIISTMPIGAPFKLAWLSITIITMIVLTTYGALRLTAGLRLSRLPVTEILKNRE